MTSNTSLLWVSLVLGVAFLVGCKEEQAAPGGSGGEAGAARAPAPGGSAGSAAGAQAASGSGGERAPYVLEVDDDLPLPQAEGLAPTPPMGWNSWNKFHCDVTAVDVMAAADAIVASGMRDAGYQYVNIDDCWQAADRAADGSYQFDPDFPDGIAPIADYVHALGLKLGVYSDRGSMTCASRTGSEGHEAEDAAAYAAWGVDYLKYDNCFSNPETIEEQYRLMADQLTATGRPIVFSLCAWRFYEWGVGVGQLWRTSSDITPDWDSILANASTNMKTAAYAGPNGWNDPDMLEVGNGGMDEDEQRAHFALWAIMAAPLIAGNDLSTMTDVTREILTNEELILVNQDALGLQGTPVAIEGERMVWAKPLNESGARAVLLLNTGSSDADITARFEEIGLANSTATVRDLWAHVDLGTFDGSYTARVPSRGALALRVTGGEPPRPRGDAFLSDLTWTYVANGLGPVERDQANGATAARDGDPISIRGQVHDKGLGVSAGSLIIFRLGQQCSRFTASVGVDDSANGDGSVVFQVLADDEALFDSGVVTGTSPAQQVEVDLTGRRRLKLRVTSAGDGSGMDRASWGSARVECAR